MPLPPACQPLHVEQVGIVTVARFTLPEVMHADVIDSVGDRLLALVEDEGRRLLVLDFTSVRKLSSALLGRLVGLHRKLLAVQGRMALCGIEPEVRQVFDLCQLPRLLHLYPDRRAAVAAMSCDGDAEAGSPLDG
jgi:anti-sigma B factor antagonist